MTEQQMLDRIQELETLVCKQKQTIENLLSPRKGKTVTSERAAKQIKPKTGTMLHDIMLFLAENPYRSCPEIEQSLSLKHQTVSARLCDLKRAGWVLWEEDGQYAEYRLSQLGQYMLRGVK